MARLDSSESNRAPPRSSTPNHPPISPSAYAASGVRQLRSKGVSSKHQNDHEYHQSAHDDESDFDSEAFGCKHTSNFDRQAWQYDNGVDGPAPDTRRRQEKLDNYFRSLSQAIEMDSGMHPSSERHHDSERRKQIFRRRAGSQTLSGLNEEEGEQEEQQHPAAAKAHFLDFSSFINPLPPANGKAKSTPSSSLRSSERTPKASDVIQFHAPFAQQQHRSHQAVKKNAPSTKQQRPVLKTRRSEGALRDRKKEREDATNASVFSQTGVATAENVGTDGLAVSDGLVSSILERQQRQQPYLSQSDRMPLPNLPKWAQDYNRTLPYSNVASTQSDNSSDSGRSMTSSYQSRPIAMGRTASEDHYRPPAVSSRYVTNGRAASGPAATIRALQQQSPSYQSLRSASSTGLQQPFTGRSQLPHESRGSISSASATSEESSDMSSVPQTPTSRNGSSELSPLHYVSSSSSSPTGYHRQSQYQYGAMEWNADTDETTSQGTPRADQHSKIIRKIPQTPVRPGGEILSRQHRPQDQRQDSEEMQNDGTIKASNRFFTSIKQKQSTVSKYSKAGHAATPSFSSSTSTTSSSSGSVPSANDVVSPSPSGATLIHPSLYSLPSRSSSTTSSSSGGMRKGTRQHEKHGSDGGRAVIFDGSTDDESDDRGHKDEEEEDSFLRTSSALAYRRGEPLSPPPSHQTKANGVVQYQPSHGPTAAFMAPPSSSSSSGTSTTGSSSNGRLIGHQRSRNVKAS